MARESKTDPQSSPRSVVGGVDVGGGGAGSSGRPRCSLSLPPMGPPTPPSGPPSAVSHLKNLFEAKGPASPPRKVKQAPTRRQQRSGRDVPTAPYPGPTRRQPPTSTPQSPRHPRPHPRRPPSANRPQGAAVQERHRSPAVRRTQGRAPVQGRAPITVEEEPGAAAAHDPQQRLAPRPPRHVAAASVSAPGSASRAHDGTGHGRAKRRAREPGAAWGGG